STLSFDSIIFPYGDAPVQIHPAFAALSGMMKTINKEMPDTRVKAVDFSFDKPLENIDEISNTYISELMSADRRVEAGYKDKERYVLSMIHPNTQEGESFVPQESTVLVTGGARGITFEMLKSLVKKYSTRLIILGRSDITQIRDKFLSEDADRAYILNELKQDMPGAKPLEIKRAVEKTIKLKETIANINYLKSMGVDVDYHSVDVADDKAIEQALKGYEHIDGVIHAAGVEESQFIQKKELNSFNRVFDTKVHGALNLIRVLKDMDYGFFITFSSVTARFGNEGQIDYTGANDMLGKILQKEKVAHPDRVYKALAWTAWKGAGMATNETVMKVLQERGLEFLPLDQGVNFFMAELCHTENEEAVFSGMDTSFDVDNIFSPDAVPTKNPDYPFLDTLIREDEENVSFSRVLDLKRDLFLLDHSKDDVPIFLGATGIEAMAEAGSRLTKSGYDLKEVKDFSIPYGIKILKNRPKEIIVEAGQNNALENAYNCMISSQFKNKQGGVMGDPKLHYQATYVFSDEVSENVKVDVPEFKPVEYDGDFYELAYHSTRLFMYGLFKSIHDIASFDGHLLITRIKDISTQEFFTGETDPKFVTNVILMDAMFQTGGLLEFITTNVLVLPYKIASLKFYRPMEKNREYLCLTRKTSSDEETNTYQLEMIDDEGNLYVKLEDFEMVKISKLEKEFQILDRIRFTE
ncbi:MAG: SDR family NAD(P)-dependent oxidoreductase, partial [Deltaproteobacteria bacterium]|nr:SDR family NAD(P)-dependent oxidoreductase [Deltaproteobacteria bacterium]